jgi:3-hydroxyacyl-CoA dehydrogenase
MITALGRSFGTCHDSVDTEQVVGMHFFDPNGNVTPVVEVVVNSQVDGAAARTGM